MKRERFSFIKRLESFKYALDGMKILILEEHNARLHFFATVVVIVLGFVLDISNSEWIMIIIVIGIVFALEIINSAIENICDFVSPERNEQIKKIKDLSAAAVLVGAVMAAIVGLIIFFPKLGNL